MNHQKKKSLIFFEELRISPQATQLEAKRASTRPPSLSGGSRSPRHLLLRGGEQRPDPTGHGPRRSSAPAGHPSAEEGVEAAGLQAFSFPAKSRRTATRATHRNFTTAFFFFGEGEPARPRPPARAPQPPKGGRSSWGSASRPSSPEGRAAVGAEPPSRGRGGRRRP